MVLIVNTTSDTGLTEGVKGRLAARGAEFDVMEAASMNISHCIGCNNCWVKTPGVCAIKDDYEAILRKLPHADQFWVITETALGFLNHKGKNIFDRIVPILNMNLEFRDNMMRHIIRYDRNPDVGLIYFGTAEREFLSRWLDRCTANLKSKSLGAYPAAEIEEAVSCMSL